MSANRLPSIKRFPKLFPVQRFGRHVTGMSILFLVFLRISLLLLALLDRQHISICRMACDFQFVLKVSSHLLNGVSFSFLLLFFQQWLESLKFLTVFLKYTMPLPLDFPQVDVHNPPPLVATTFYDKS